MSEIDNGPLVIDRPFAIFIEPAPDVPGQWLAHIVGCQLDNITCGEGPIDAVKMAAELLEILTTPEEPADAT